MPRRVVEDNVFAGRLKYYREISGLTKKKLADLLGISDQLYNRYENKNAQPDIELLNNIARVLHVSVDNLLGFQTDYSNVDKALDILNIVNISFNRNYDTHKFQFSLPDGHIAELDQTQLIACVYFAKQQTDELIKDPLDSLFTAFFLQVFWDSIKRRRYQSELYNDVQIFNIRDTNATTFAERLRFYREDKKLTQTQLAKRLGLTPQTYNRYEKNGAKPSILLLINIANALGITVNRLIGGYDPSRCDLALFYLSKVSIDYKAENESIVVRRPLREELTPDEMDAYEASGEKNPTEGVPLTESELCYYLNFAWETANRKTEQDMDTIVATTFRPLFFAMLQSPPSTEGSNISLLSVNDYLYRKYWNEKNDRNSIVVKESGKSKIVKIEDIDNVLTEGAPFD